MVRGAGEAAWWGLRGAGAWCLDGMRGWAAWAARAGDALRRGSGLRGERVRRRRELLVQVHGSGVRVTQVNRGAAG